MNDIIKAIQNALLDAEVDPTIDDICTAIEICKRLKEVAREFDERAKELAKAYVVANGPFEANGIRYYVATEKKTKCNDVRAMMEAALNGSGGDVDRICGLLSTNAWKPGACKKFLGDQFEEFWTVTDAVDLKTKEVKPPALQIVNTQFITSGAAGETEQGDE